MSALPAPTSLQMPPVIRDAGMAGAPMQYDWDLDVSDTIAYPRDDEHRRLRQAV